MKIYRKGLLIPSNLKSYMEKDLTYYLIWGIKLDKGQGQITKA